MAAKRVLRRAYPTLAGVTDARADPGTPSVLAHGHRDGDVGVDVVTWGTTALLNAVCQPATLAAAGLQALA
jgi:hypothetical protein